jgi:holliday junction DNA helicase RuvB
VVFLCFDNIFFTPYFADMIIKSEAVQEPKTPKVKKPISSAVSELHSIIDPLQDTLQLRPQNMSGYVGQDKIIKQLSLIIQSAKIRETVPEHILFHGQPGLGKTTLAGLISNELGASLKTVAAPALQKTGDIVSLLMNIEPNTVLFIDEIHRLKAPLEEVLYSGMEDGVVDIMMGKGQGVNLGRFELNPFVLIGATTQLGKVSKPLKDRFPTIFHLEPYAEKDILNIIERSLQILGLNLDDEARILVCKRCRGIPRIANNVLKRFLDLQVVHSIEKIDYKTAKDFLEELGVFELGLTNADYNYLRALKHGSLGLKTIAGVLMEDPETLEIVTEPYLIYLGFLDKNSDGRRLTVKGQEFAKKL